MSVLKLGALVVLARAGTSLVERPDRRLRAMLAMQPYGMTLLGAVAAARARYPSAIAVQDDREAVTYDQLWHQSRALAVQLQETGLTADGRVGLLHLNSVTFVSHLLACAHLGADVVLLNTAMAGAQLADVAESEKLDVVLHDDSLSAPAESCLSARRISSRELERPSRLPVPGTELPRPARASKITVLTSGTTGRPKGAVRSSGGDPTAGPIALLAALRVPVRATMVIPAPFFHGWGLAMLLLGLGQCATIVTRSAFDAETTLRDIARHRARFLVVVPVMLQRICELPPAVLGKVDTSSLRVIASSGSALPGTLATQALDRFGPLLFNIYGSTEAAIATVARPGDLRLCPTTAGRPAFGTRVEVLDSTGTPVLVGTVGAVFVRSGARFEGYSDGSGKPTVRDLVSTGDRGRFDERGCLHIDGREDDMIVSGGENVYPGEVEDRLLAHPGVREAAVVGVPDQRFGQALKAFVVARDGAELDEQVLKAFVRDGLARYKVPRTVVVLAELPRTSTGKILRRRLT